MTYLALFIVSPLSLAGIELIFVHSSSYGDMFWIFDENSVDNTPMFCCTAVLTQRQGLFSSSCCPTSEEAGGARSWEGTEPGQLTQLDQRDIP